MEAPTPTPSPTTKEEVPTNSIYHLDDGNYRVTANGHVTNYNSQLEVVQSTANVTRKVSKTSDIYLKLVDLGKSIVDEEKKYTLIETVGKYNVYLDKTTYEMRILIDGKYEEVTKPLVDKLKLTMSKKEALKLDMKASQIY